MAKAMNINGVNFKKVNQYTFDGKFNDIEFSITHKNEEFTIDIFKANEDISTEEYKDEDYIESVEMDTLVECADYIREQYA